jgi:hypothetical protein
MSLQEIKRSSVQYIQEIVTKPYIAQVVPNASFEQAQILDSNGKWEEESHQLYTLAKDSELGSSNRSKALILLSQTLINKTNFRLAEKCLDTLEAELDVMDPTARIIVSAQIHEKRAWISDYLGDPDAEIAYLEKAKNSIGSLSDKQRELNKKETDEIVLTANHFIGRACIAKAGQEPDKKHYWIGRAMNNFASGIADLDKLITKTDTRHANIGFQYAQMAHAMLAIDNFDRAEEFIDIAGNYFYQHSVEYPDSGIMAQQETLRGLFYAARAQKSYKTALAIRLEKERYPAGEARAHAGIAATALAQGKIGEFMEHTIAAIKSSPQILLQG